jgi:ferritin-like metal-binding protein YciE
LEQIAAILKVEDTVKFTKHKRCSINKFTIKYLLELGQKVMEKMRKNKVFLYDKNG